MKERYFSQEIEKTIHQMEEKNKRLKQFASCRVISFGLLVFCVTWGIREGSIIGWVLGIVIALVFGNLVKRYNALKKKVQYDEAMKKVLEKYLMRLKDDASGWKSFEENGKAYLKETDTVSSDLDLIGRSSVYQYLSVCHTPIGKKKLAEALSKGCASNEEIKKRQGAVSELIEDEAFALKLQALIELMAEEERQHVASRGDQGKFIAAAKEKKKYVSKGMNLLSYILPFITLFAIISAFVGIYRVPAYIIACVGILVQLGIGLLGGRENKKVLDCAYSFTKKLSVYEAFFTALEEKNFKSDHLKELQGRLTASGGAVKGLKDLKGLSAAIEVRFNVILYSIVMALLMWDVHCKDGLSKWQKQYGEYVEGWLNVIGEVEVLLSLAVLGQVKENYCMPIILDEEKPKLAFKALAHPLIQENRAISNSFEIADSTCIITGSNMSGKTTFLRSIGVNLALAYAGGVVLGETFTASRMKILTSMRANDRVDQGISTFYAEILRIKEMVEYSEKKKPMLALIDEIFKGTNSVDRIVGAEAAIKRLGLPWVSVMVSTHDFELCHLQINDKRKMMNYHFEEHYQADKILFDYKLKPGVSETKNAQYLLKMAGIISQ